MGGVRILLNPHALKSLNSIERTLPIIMCATLISNLCTMIVSCFLSPTNTSYELDFTTFYNGLSSLAQHIPKHNVLIISGDINAQTGKNKNNTFCLHNLPIRNGAYLADFSLKNNLSHLNTKFQKREGKP